jgi:wobble nucleotide-excising tRNase
MIQTNSETLTQGKKFAKKIRVFNIDYIQKNIGDFEKPLSHILILGEENKEIASKLEADLKLENERKAQITEIEKKIDNIKSEKSTLFTQIATTIGEAVFGTASRDYRKPQAEAAFAKTDSNALLDEKDLNEHRESIRQKKLPPIDDQVFLYLGEKIENSTLLDFIAKLSNRASIILKQTAESVIIERLRENPQISTWVESGLKLHEYHGARNCEFCDQPLLPDRLKLLANYFNKADQEFKIYIDNEINLIKESKSKILNLKMPVPQALYSEMQNSYENLIKEYEVEISSLISQISSIETSLIEKLTLRSSSYNRNLMSDIGPLVEKIIELEKIINQHNLKTENFTKAQEVAKKKIEQHYLASIKAKVDSLDKQLKQYEEDRRKLIEGDESLPDTRSLIKIEEAIREKRSKISNAHTAGAILSDNLKKFLGRDELRFENSEEGYLVIRKNRPAKKLREGEKTAIAFLHFLIHLNDQNFSIEDGIIVVDDPISSLDSASLYQAFSFLKNKTKKAYQLFVFTHNFQFLKLLIDWMEHVPKKDGKTYLMVLCDDTIDGRISKLAKLDPLLQANKTEYQYLFSLLYRFKSNGYIEGSYHIPNIARKVLETFLEFHRPSELKLYEKLDKIDFDEDKKTAIYKFSNALSHFTGQSFDPALVAETQKNVTYLLEMIHHVSPDHYIGLEELSKP